MPLSDPARLATAAAIAGYASSALVIPVVLVGLLADRRLEPALGDGIPGVYLTTVLLLFLPAYLGFPGGLVGCPLG